MPNSSTPIRRTLMRMIFLSSGAVLAVTTIAFCTYEFLTFRQSSVQQLQTLSQAIASNSTAALAFDNADDASTVLAAFRADPHIVAAALYDAGGKLVRNLSARAAGGALSVPGRRDGLYLQPRRARRFSAGRGGLEIGWGRCSSNRTSARCMRA